MRYYRPAVLRRCLTAHATLASLHPQTDSGCLLVGLLFPTPRFYIFTNISVLGFWLAYWMLISSNNTAVQSRFIFRAECAIFLRLCCLNTSGICEIMQQAEFVQNSLTVPFRLFRSASVVFTHTCRTYDDRKYTFNSSSAGFREVWPHLPCCWPSLMLWICLACRMVLLSPKAHHMAESDLDDQTAIS